MFNKVNLLLICLVGGLLISACGPSRAELNATATRIAANVFATQTAAVPTATSTPTVTPTTTPTATSTPTPTPTSTSTPTPTPTPTSLPLLASGWENLIIDTVCLEVKQAYPDVAKPRLLPFEDMVEDILQNAGLHVEARDGDCDATLHMTLTGQARGATYYGESGSQYCYTGADIHVQATLTAAGGYPTVTRSANISDPPSFATLSCPDEPRDAPFNQGLEALIDGLVQLWGGEIFFSALQTAGTYDAGYATVHGFVVDRVYWMFYDMEPAERATYVPVLIKVLEYEQTPPVSLRETARILMTIGPDAMGAVPALIRVLADDSAPDHSEYDEQVIAALKAITGQDFGQDVARWQQMIASVTKTPAPPTATSPSALPAATPTRTPTPVRKQTYAQIGQAVTDPASDVSEPYIDVVAFTSTLDGEKLRVTFQLRDVPPELTFNRAGVGENAKEYSWGVYVDIDSNPQTGDSKRAKGADYELSAKHFAFSPGSPSTGSIERGVQVNTWKAKSSGGWSVVGDAAIVVDAQADTITLIGTIPGISAESRLFFETCDYFAGCDDMEYIETEMPATAETPTATPVAHLSGELAYSVLNSTSGAYDTYIINVDGTSRRLLAEYTRQPAFRPDGVEIALVSEKPPEEFIVVMNVDGSGRRQVSTNVEDVHPTWSPDGRAIAFISVDGRLLLEDALAREAEQLKYYVGADQRPVGVVGKYPVWLHDNRIALTTCNYGIGSGGSCGLFIMDLSGSTPIQLTTDPSDLAFANYQDQLAFMSPRDGDWEIYKMNVSGVGLVKLTDNNANDGLPAWSPDGGAIAFISDRDGGWAIWVMNADGSNQRKLFNLDGTLGPDWVAEKISWAP